MEQILKQNSKRARKYPPAADDMISPQIWCGRAHHHGSILLRGKGKLVELIIDGANGS